MHRRGLPAILPAAALLVVLLTLDLTGLAGRVMASPGAMTAGTDAAFKRGGDDDREDDEDGGDGDHSGHGRGRGRGGHRDGIPIAPPLIPADQRGDLVIEIVDERFLPANATLRAGQRVTFVNLDDDEHTATGIGFDTGTLLPGAWATVSVERAGDAPFLCQYHPEMTGEITVLTAEGTAATPAASPVALPEAATEVVIDVLDFAFATPRLEIAPGTNVTWVNRGRAPHTVTGPFADSGMLQPGDHFSFVFMEPGELAYACAFHPDMVGTIVVASPATGSTSGG